MKLIPTRRGARYETNAKRIASFGLMVAKISPKRCGGARVWVEYAFPKLKAYFGPEQKQNTLSVRENAFRAEETQNTPSLSEDVLWAERSKSTPSSKRRRTSPLRNHLPRAGPTRQWPRPTYTRGPGVSGACPFTAAATGAHSPGGSGTLAVAAMRDPPVGLLLCLCLLPLVRGKQRRADSTRRWPPATAAFAGGRDLRAGSAGEVATTGPRTASGGAGRGQPKTWPWPASCAQAAPASWEAAGPRYD